MRRVITRGFAAILPAAVAILFSANTINAQNVAATGADEIAETGSKQPDAAAKALVTPIYSNYRGIKIGMAATEVRKIVNHLKEKGVAQDFFVFSENETAQVFYDSNRNVRAISIDYLGNVSRAPSSEQVLGKALQPNANGSMYALERYPKSGYWVSYSRTAGDNPIVTITMQKM